MREMRGNRVEVVDSQKRPRVAIGIWLLVAGAILLGEGYWWGVVMVAPAALHFYLAFRLHHAVQR